MIKINEQFSARKYPCGWELHVAKKTKKGEDTSDVTYWPTFYMLSRAVIDRSLGGCEDLENVCDEIEGVHADILEAINQHGIGE